MFNQVDGDDSDDVKTKRDSKDGNKHESFADVVPIEVTTWKDMGTANG